MRRPTSKTLGLVIMLADTGCAVFSLFFVALIRNRFSGGDSLSMFREGWPLLAGMMVLWLAVSDRLGFNRVYRSPADLLSRAIVSSVLLSVGVAALAFFAKLSFSRQMMVYFVAAFFVAALTSRLILRDLIRRKWISGAGTAAVIIGTGPVARELAAKIEDDPALMCQIVGCLAPESYEAGRSLGDVVPTEIISTIGVAKYLASKNIQQVFIVLPNSGDPEVQKLIAECRNTGIDVAFVPHAYELYISRAVTQDVSGIPLISIERRISSPHFLVIKALADYMTALVLLIITLPLLVIAGVVLRAKRGRALRLELRCGTAGRRFWMYRLNVDRYQTNLDTFEQLLVRTSLSELPQLFNVLRGEMSVIGPRPEPPDRVDRYSEWEKQRLLYKPGVTGLAQVRGLREQHSSDEKARYDLQYPLSWSPLLDLTLIVQTVLTLVRRGVVEIKAVLVANRDRHIRTTQEVLHADRPQPSAH